MGLTPASPVWRKCWERLGCVGIWKAPGLQPPPPELSSPAIKITSASLAHWLLRNGCRSCWRACWKAGLIASTAEIGKTHLGEASSRQGTAKREGRQVAKGAMLTAAVLIPLVILSGATVSHRETAAQSKDPYVRRVALRGRAKRKDRGAPTKSAISFSRKG